MIGARRINGGEAAGGRRDISPLGIAYTAAVLLFAGWIVPLLFYFYVRSITQRPWLPHWRNLGRLVQNFYPGIVFLVFLVTLGIVLINRGVLRSKREERQVESRLPVLRQVLLGVGVGLLVFVIAVLAIHIPGAKLFVGAVLVWPFVIPLLFSIVVAVCLPLTMEVVVREIVMSSLLKYAGPLMAVVVSSLLFALAWPLFGFWVGLVLGTAASVIYYRTRSIVACVLANATATIFIGIYLICRTAW